MRVTNFLVLFKGFYSIQKHKFIHKDIHFPGCTTNGKMCKVIIDSETSENIVSSKLVQTLNLKLDPQPHTYTE